MLNVQIKKLYPDVIIPAYETPGSSGVDLRAYCPDGPITIGPEKTALVKTGLKISIQDDSFEAQIRPRSGLSLKTFLRIANSPGTIDASYRGEIGIICYNAATETFDMEANMTRTIVIKHGDRIAQMVFCPVYKAKFEEVSELDVTERGEGGFGHTGIQ